MASEKRSFLSKWKEKSNQKQQAQLEVYPRHLMDIEVYEEILQHIETSDQELAKLIVFMVEEDTFTVDIENKTFLLLTETEGYAPYSSDIVEGVIDGSIQARKERVAFYEDMQKDYEAKVAEKYEESVLSNYKKEIEEKCRPSVPEVWIRNVTTHIIIDDLSVRDFIRLYLEKIKGIRSYIDATYPPK